jgi:hypothetical protein
MIVTKINTAGLISLALNQNCTPGVANHVALHSANLLFVIFALFDKLGY